MRNDRATQVLGHITLFPEVHHQGHWSHVPESVAEVDAATLQDNPSCGTTLCYAGTTAALFAPRNAVFVAGDGEYVYIPKTFGDYVRSRFSTGMHYDPLENKAHSSFDYRQRYDRVYIMTFAQEALGLDDGQAAWLFAGDRTKQELFDGVRYIMSHPNATKAALNANCTHRY